MSAQHPACLSRRRLLGTGVAGLGLATASARAQEAWPGRTIRIIVPYAPGGGTDITTRAIAENLTKQFSQSVIVENKPGANGIIGAEAVARSAPDGYTLLAPNSTHPLLRHITRQMPFDAIRDFTPVALQARYCFVLVAGVNTPFQDVPGLIAYAKANPGKLAQGTADAVSGYSATQFARAAGITMNEVRYSGSGAAVGDLTGGHLPMSWLSTATAMTLLPGGKVRPLAVTSPERSSFLPDCPALSEFGLQAANFVGWFGLFGPARMPPVLTMRLNEAVQVACATQSVRDRMRSLAVEPAPARPEDILAMIREEDERWARAAREGLLKAE